jgi:hypothetical protein
MVSLWLRKGTQMKLLTSEQKLQLVEIIIDEFGTGISHEEFTDALLSLLEDISGFETAQQHTITKLTQQLWSHYHE